MAFRFPPVVQRRSVFRVPPYPVSSCGSLLRGLLAAGLCACCGCQKLPPGVLAGGAAPDAAVVAETRSERPENARLTAIEKRLAAIEATATPFFDDATAAAENDRLRGELATLTQQLAASEQLLAEQFGRRAADRLASVPGTAATR